MSVGRFESCRIRGSQAGTGPGGTGATTVTRSAVVAAPGVNTVLDFSLSAHVYTQRSMPVNWNNSELSVLRQVMTFFFENERT